VLNPALAAATRQLNVVLIIAEQWRPLTLTPSLKRLGAESTHFTRCYATNPARGPARTSILSGCYPHIRTTPPKLWEPVFIAFPVSSSPVPADGVDLPLNVPYKYEDTARRNFAAYLGACRRMDEELGKILDAAPADSVIVFTSDRGAMLGAHGLEGDGLPFEESVRVPLFIRYPGRFRRGEVDDLLMSTIDILPSLLALFGIDLPPEMQGRDLSATMINGEGERPESIYSYGRIGEPGEWRMLVRGLDKLVVNTKLEATHLFNLGQDPLEMRNLATEIGSARNRDELKAHLRAWMKRAGDGMDPSSGLKIR
jgi:arylsulfatase A-like enzyme